MTRSQHAAMIYEFDDEARNALALSQMSLCSSQSLGLLQYSFRETM
jgi:hypothetical protein